MSVQSYEVSLQFKDPKGIKYALIKQTLETQGLFEHDIIEQQHEGEYTLSLFKNSSLSALQLKRQLQKFQFKGVSVGYQRIAAKDWQTLWKKDFKPFQLTDKFDVIPFEYRKKPGLKKRVPIYIDTSCAFGTGLHATTKFMAGFVDRLEGKFTSFMDIGTGTGILSIVAHKCGGEELLALDLNQDIIRVARENFKENQVPTTGLRAVNFLKLNSKRKFDFVAANLITHDLIDFKQKIISFVKPGGYLALSGISLKNYTLLREAFKPFPLRCLRIQKGEGWVGILFKRQRT